MLDNLTFEINSKIEVAWNNDYYKSSIEDVEEGFISISIPIKEGQYVPLRPGEQVEILYYNLNEIYKFNTLVIGRRTDRIPVILLAYPKEVFKVQRRKFVRVPIVYTIEYCKLGNNVDSKSLQAVMVDLSGGGMRIKLKEQVSLGDMIKATVPLGADQINIKGEVVRIETEADTKRSICGINFIDLDDRDREKLIKFLFQVMRDQMKKG